MLLFLLLFLKCEWGKKITHVFSAYSCEFAQKKCGWVGDSFMIPTDIFRAYSHEYASFFDGVINIYLVCRSTGYFVFV